MNKLIVIPARGGSKGIPHKNIHPLNGKPLLCYTLELLLAAELTETDIAVSTDSADIKALALSFGQVDVVDRPEEISGDRASTEAALLHAIDVMEQKKGKKYQAVLTLQPTSPLRKKETLKAFIEAFEKNYPQYDALLSLNESRSDYWIQTEDGNYERLYKDAPRRRQERKPLDVENSAYYMTDVKALRGTCSVLGTHANGFIIDETEAVDINEPVDLVIAGGLLVGTL